MDCFLVKNGGGAPLNFKVVGNPQPATPKENTIWVNTDVPIGKWYFDASQPDDLQEGDVWFSVGTSSPVGFNALRKNGIQVYPLSAKQFVGGALVSKDAQIYQGGAWVELWNGELFNNGNQYEKVTGGWQKAVTAGTGGSITFEDRVVFSLNAGSSSAGTGSSLSASHKSTVDLSGYSTLSADAVHISGGTAKAVIEISTSPTTRTRDAYTGEFVLSNEITDMSLDISGFNGKYYVHLVTHNGGVNGSSAKCSIGNVRLA